MIGFDLKINDTTSTRAGGRNYADSRTVAAVATGFSWPTSGRISDRPSRSLDGRSESRTLVQSARWRAKVIHVLFYRDVINIASARKANRSINKGERGIVFVVTVSTTWSPWKLLKMTTKSRLKQRRRNRKLICSNLWVMQCSMGYNIGANTARRNTT